MFNNRIAMMVISSGLALAAFTIIAIGLGHSATSITTRPDTDGDVLVFRADQDHLQPCSAHQTMRRFELAAPFTVIPTSTPDPAAPTPMPAPSEDRVGFPHNYLTEFKLLFVFDRPDRQVIRVVCANAIAAQHEAGEEFDYGSVLVMISYAAQLDGDGQPILDENGHFIAEQIVGLNVQRKGEGFGAAYGQDRAGEWEFVAYNADGSYQHPPQGSNFCAVCHSSEAGAEVDYVFRMNLFHEGESALIAPNVNDNEVSIYLNAFHQPVLRVKVGTVVTWYNDDETDHQIVAAHVDEDGKVVEMEDPLFRSSVLPSINSSHGALFRFRFDEAGEYLYLCSLHAHEVGRIIVTE